jgi:hypothetical protein
MAHSGLIGDASAFPATRYSARAARYANGPTHQPAKLDRYALNVEREWRADVGTARTLEVDYV